MSKRIYENKGCKKLLPVWELNPALPRIVIQLTSGRTSRYTNKESDDSEYLMFNSHRYD